MDLYLGVGETFPNKYANSQVSFLSCTGFAPPARANRYSEVCKCLTFYQQLWTIHAAFFLVMGGFHIRV